MHCPRCGQQQVSENIKFCSRCGFLLELVPELLANGGTLPQLAELNKNKKWLTRKNGIKFSVLWAIVMWLFLTPFMAITNAPEELVAVTAVAGFAGMILMLLISFFFLDNKPQFANPPVSFRSDGMPQNLSGTAGQGALPPQQSVPASSYIPPQPGRWQTTNDLTAPGSVTEQTTKLLEKDE